MRSADLAEEMAHRENDRYGNAPLRRAPDPDRIAGHLATGLTPAPWHPCPVCGTTGYRKARSTRGEDTIYWCRRGHPHYVPTPRIDTLQLENNR